MEELLHQRDTVGVQDFILLEDFTNPKSFISNLKKRFKEQLIYTSIGSVLVSVNPYESLDIYNDKIIRTYRSVNFYELPPHIFSIADSAYRSMCSEQRDQCVLISGESGSGKTEASKKVLEYVALTSTLSDDMGRIRDRLLQSNPILEAFGNAKTNCNDNSSRFGKYMDIQFNFKGAPVGGHINNYLLEKSRVVHQANGERNFHIFYQLLESGDEKLLHKLSLEKPDSNYFYLEQGESSEVDTIDDCQNFYDVRKALETCEFGQDQQQCLFAIIAFVLHLGDIEFSDENGHAIVSDPDNVHTISKIVGCSFSKLLAALQSRTIDTRHEKVMTPFNIDQAFYARDALAKNVYDRVFSWIVKTINASLDEKGVHRSTLMGLLDIYGFEIFAVNSFEQFCINYCNEKLQQLFIELTLKSEQEEYFREGIEWEPVEYFNNKIICDLVEDKTEGIIALLDEECLRPGNSTDASFLSKLTWRSGKHPHFVSHETSDTATRKTITRKQFRLRHYAGDVTYNIDGFIDKNNDLFFRDLKEAMTQSRNAVMAECFPESDLESRKRPLSAASQFKNSLAELMQILMSKEPSYVRCIKPNEHKKPELFEEKIVLHQIKYLGLMENVRVRRAGFAYRRPYEVFLKRYKSLCPATWPHYKGTVKEGVKVLVQHLQYDPHGYRLGTSKLFIKSPQVLFATEDAYQRRRHVLATMIQSIFRCHVQRLLFKEMKASAIRVQCMWRRVSAKQKMIQRRRAVSNIRRFIKGFMLRKIGECEENEKFILFTRHNYLMRLRRNLPHNVLDKSWLEPPELLQEASALLKDLCTKNLTLKYVKQIDPLKKLQLEEKVVAEEMFRYKKESYPYSVKDPFATNRLASHHDLLLETVFMKTTIQPGESVKYSSAVIKYDRHGYKPRSRVLVATDQTIYILDAKDFKMKEKFAFSMVNGMLLSKLSDGLFVIVTNADLIENGSKGDVILQADYVIEAVTKIAIAGSLTKIVKVSSAYSIEHQFSHGKLGVIDFSEGADYRVKKGRGHHMSVCVPRVIYGPSGRSISATHI